MVDIRNYLSIKTRQRGPVRWPLSRKLDERDGGSRGDSGGGSGGGDAMAAGASHSRRRP